MSKGSNCDGFLKKSHSHRRLSVIGAGIVGTATGFGFHSLGHDVAFCDISIEKLIALKKEGYAVTDDVHEAVARSEISFVCVPTPTTNGQMVLKCVENVVTDIGEALRHKNEYHLVVIRSTVLPSTTRLKVIPLLESISQLKVGLDFGVCVNPEFLRKITALEDFLNPSRIIIGQFDEQAGDLLQTLYSQFPAPIIKTNLDNAEMIKYVANSYLATKISFFNEMHMISKDFGFDPDLIANAVAMDSRIGIYGSSGGRPFEGECLPKDLDAFIGFIESKGHNPKMLKATNHVNGEMARRSCEETNPKRAVLASPKEK